MDTYRKIVSKLNRYSLLKPIWVLKWSKWKGEMYLEVSTGLTAINIKVSGKNDNANGRGPLIHSFTLTEMCMKESGKRVLYMEFSICIKKFLIEISIL